MEDQRKRTQESLDRRFAQAKEEFHAQQQKSRKRPIEDMKPVMSTVEHLPVGNMVIKPSFKASSRKDVEVNEPVYFELSHYVNEKLLTSCNQISDRKTMVDHILHDLFRHGDSAQKYIQGSKSMRIENTILLDNYVEKCGFSNLSRVQAHQKSSKRSKKHMSLKQHKKKETYDLPEEFHKFEIFEPMHEKWKSYISRLLNNVGCAEKAICICGTS